MHKVVKNAYEHYSVWTASDAQGTVNEGYPKSWFYFEVGGFSNRRVAFSVHRVHFLCALVPPILPRQKNTIFIDQSIEWSTLQERREIGKD